MPNKQDHKLEQWLASYDVADADPSLLNRIMANAARTPQQPRASAWREQARGWALEAVAIAAVGFLGFWAGNATLVSSASVTAPVAVMSTNDLSGNIYMDKVIFGAKSLNEVKL